MIDPKYGDIVDDINEPFNVDGSEKLNNTIRYLVDQMKVVDPESISASLAEKAKQSDLTNGLALKRDKSVLITMNDVDQDVKTAMTGGSVAVVGVNSTGTTNIIDKAVTPQKLDRLYKKANTKVVTSASPTLSDVETGSICYVQPASSTTVYSHGKNFFPFSIRTYGALTLIAQDAESITLKATAGQQYVGAATNRYYLPAGTYSFHRVYEVLSGTPSTSTGYMYIYRADDANGTNESNISVLATGTERTLTITAGYYSFSLYININHTLSTDITVKFHDLQVELTSFSTYEKYNGEIKTGTDLIFNTLSNMGLYNPTDVQMTVTYPAVDSVSLDSLSTRVTTLENPQTKVVNCWGDSLTAGVGGNGTSYPSVLLNNLGTGWSVNNFGVGGETTQAIAGRQGGIPLYVSPFTIPADTTATQITLNSWGGNSVTLNDVVGVNPCTIADIQGTISLSGGNFYFARSTAGTAKTITNPTTIVTNAMKVKNKNDSIIIWIGTNGSWWDTDQETSSRWLCQQIQNMIDYSGCKNYLVIGMTTQPDATQTVIDKWMTRSFGGKFIKLRNYLVNYGLSDAGITPTAQDNTDISAGVVPTSLRVDGTHYNASGYTVIGNLIYKRGHELGYW
jgi:lysophospholipase L1-like esterase